MNERSVINEFAKMRHLNVGLLAAVQFAIILGVALYAPTSDPDFNPASEGAWNFLLMGACSGVYMASPLLLAVLASRQVDIEHQGNGWLLSATSGVTPGQLSRAKLLVLGSLVTAATALAILVALAAGLLLLGITAPIAIGRWLGLIAALLVINLVVLAVHIVLSAKIENQLVGIGIGLLGLIFAMVALELPTWAAHLVPWGYYALAMPAEYGGTGLVEVSPAYASIAALGVVAAVLFALITGVLDRQEA